MYCEIANVVKGGHGDQLGMKQGDRVYSLAGIKVPHDNVVLVCRDSPK